MLDLPNPESPPEMREEQGKKTLELKDYIYILVKSCKQV